MKRIAFRVVPAVALLVAGIAWVTPRVSGQSSADAEHEERRVADVHRRSSRQQVLAARSDQRQQLQQDGSRLAIQDRQPRPASRDQARRHAADGQGHALRHGRHAPRRRRARRADRRAEVDVQHGRGRARHALGAASALGPRPVVLDRRQRRRAHPLRHDRLSPGGAQRQDRPADPRRSATRASSISRSA